MQYSLALSFATIEHTFSLQVLPPAKNSLDPCGLYLHQRVRQISCMRSLTCVHDSYDTLFTCPDSVPEITNNQYNLSQTGYQSSEICATGPACPSMISIWKRKMFMMTPMGLCRRA